MFYWTLLVVWWGSIRKRCSEREGVKIRQGLWGNKIVHMQIPKLYIYTLYMLEDLWYKAVKPLQICLYLYNTISIKQKCIYILPREHTHMNGLFIKDLSQKLAKHSPIPTNQGNTVYVRVTDSSTAITMKKPKALQPHEGVSQATKLKEVSQEGTHCKIHV